MERERNATANTFNGAPSRRWAKDVIVLSTASARPKRSVEPVIVVGEGQGQHSETSEKIYLKTKLYDKYEATGRCMYEDGCTFVHGRAELRPLVPPFGHAVGGGRVMNGGGKVCFNFRDKGTCHFGDKCAFPHGATPASPGHAIRLNDQKVLTNERRSVTPPARTSSGPRYAAPGIARAYPYPSVLPPAARDGLAEMPGENYRKRPNRLMLMSQRKVAGMFGDWPGRRSETPE